MVKNSHSSKPETKEATYKMKLSAFALVISCGAERCIDRNLGNRCQSACHGALINCKEACSDGDTS